jgi:pilus assembly protein CpaC
VIARFSPKAMMFFAPLLPGTASMTARSDRRLLKTIAAASALLLSAMASTGLKAQEKTEQTFTEQPVASPKVKATAQDASRARRISLSSGRSIVVELPRAAKEIFIGDPTIANAVIRTARKMYVIAIAEGTTTIFVNDGEGRQIAAFDVNVAKERGSELQALREVLKQTFPDANIEVRGVGQNIILTGEVDSLLEAQRALEIASNLVGTGLVGGGAAITATGTAGGALTVPTVTGKVINGLRVSGKDQVMLKVTIAEVRRDAVKELGVDLNGSWQVGNFASNVGGINIGYNTESRANTSLTATIRALEDQGVFRTLAEPTLTAVSGESATFNAGGEVPIRTRECDETRCFIATTFKPVGVALGFTPVVLSGGRISLRVATGVTEEGTNRGAEIGDYLPSFQTRKTETTVEIPSGGSLVTAGLIQIRSESTFKGVPGLMKLPVIGSLFRSRNYQRRETELMIMVTPFIVNPVSASQLPSPTDGFVDASDPASAFMGRVNKVYGAKNPNPGDGYRAPVGFIAD